MVSGLLLNFLAAHAHWARHMQRQMPRMARFCYYAGVLVTLKQTLHATIMSLSYLARGLAGSFVLLLAAGCSGGSAPTDIGFTVVRQVVPEATLQNSNVDHNSNLTGSAPLTVYYQINGSRRIGVPGLPNDTLPWSQLFTKVEADFGEGDGWVDVTSDLALWNSQPTGPPHFNTAYMSSHRYAAAGSYRMRGRITYFDDDVVESDPAFEIVVTAT